MLERLSAEQRALLRQAAEDAGAQASHELPDEQEAATAYCAFGGGIARITDDALAELHDAVAPVYAELETDAVTAALLDQPRSQGLAPTACRTGDRDLRTGHRGQRRLSDDECVVDPTIVSRLLGRQRRDDPLGRLTGRETEVLTLVAEGMSNVAIARRLVITERTVEAHTASIFAKLGLEVATDTHRRVLAVLTFLRS